MVIESEQLPELSQQKCTHYLGLPVAQALDRSHTLPHDPVIEEDAEASSGLLISLKIYVEEEPAWSSRDLLVLCKGCTSHERCSSPARERGLFCQESFQSCVPPSQKGFFDRNSTRTEGNQLAVPTSSGKFHVAQANLFLGKRGPWSPAGEDIYQPSLQRAAFVCKAHNQNQATVWPSWHAYLMSDETEMNQLPLFPSSLSGCPWGWFIIAFNGKWSDTFNLRPCRATMGKSTKCEEYGKT